MLMTVQRFFFASSESACANVPTCFTIGFSRCLNGSRFQVELLELLRCRAEVAEVVNGRASQGEGERLERFLEHLVEIFPRGEAGRDVRMVILAGMLGHEVRNVGD